MSEAYVIDGITVTPQGGGFYHLDNPALPETVKVRGKEHADAKAVELGAQIAAGGDPAAHIDQGELPAAPPVVDATELHPGGEAPASAAEVADLKAQIAALTDMITKSVLTTGGAVPEPINQMGDVANEYSGIMSDKAKVKLKSMGIDTTDIILEEDETIPPTGLFVSINGRAYMIMPGEPVTVPNFVLEVLDNAIMSTPTVDPKSQKVLGYRNRSKYPYRKI